MERESEIRQARILPRTSFWLLPVAEEGSDLARIISQLADRFGGPVFAPHVTVYSGPAGDIGEAARILEKIATTSGEISLRCNGLEFSDRYSKSCYLSFRSEPRLEEMSRMIAEMSASQVNYLLRPHLSLFYGRLTRQEREEIRGLIELPEAVGFAGLIAMATTPEVNSAAEVERWLQVDALKL